MTTRQEILSNLFESLSLMHRALLAHKDMSLQKVGMSRPQFELLCYLERHGEVTMKEITALMHVTSSAMTQLIEGLVQLKFLVRTQDTTDRRIVKVSLTKQGEKRLSTFRKTVFDHMIPKFEGIHEKELQAMSETARKIAENAKHQK
jgi:DNA-binding MarR family transcriptional regulator